MVKTFDPLVTGDCCDNVVTKSFHDSLATNSNEGTFRFSNNSESNASELLGNASSLLDAW